MITFNCDVLDELFDRYGDVPKATMNLLNIALLRSAAMKCGVSSIVEDVSDVRIYPEKFNMAVWMELSEVFKNRLKLTTGESVCVHFKFMKNEDRPVIMHKLFTKYLECQKNING